MANDVPVPSPPIPQSWSSAYPSSSHFLFSSDLLFFFQSRQLKEMGALWRQVGGYLPHLLPEAATSVDLMHGQALPINIYICAVQL